jgi:hypothetical protein
VPESLRGQAARAPLPSAVILAPARTRILRIALSTLLVLAGGLLVAPAAARAAWPTPIELGKESAYAEFNGGDLVSANDLLRDVWPARSPRKPVKLDWPLSWTEDPYTDAYWRFYFYALRPTSSLLWAYRTTGDDRYLQRLIAILRSFAAYDKVRPVDKLTFDNKHAAAYRAMVLVNHYAKLKRWGVLPADLDTDLLVSIQKLGEFLAVRGNWEDTHNHGFNEAIALLLIADNFPALPAAGSWRQVGADRLMAMLANTIDADGVEVENSPFYHVYVLGMVAEISTWAGRYEPAIAGPYADAARKMLRYAAYVTEPHGMLPMLGATATTNLPAQDPAVYGPLRGIEPAFDWVFSRGALGTPPASGTALFDVSGLFTLRSAIAAGGQRTDQTFMTFDAGIYRTEHSHQDALSVTTYSHGATVLPEAGLFTYDKGVDYDYFHGTRGHNTVMVDGANQREGDATPGPYGRLAGGGTWASGSSELYAGVRHDRTVVILRQGLALVLDRLASGSAHRYDQIWHLPPGTLVTETENGALAAGKNGKPALTIAQANPQALGLEPHTGETNPLKGWSSNAYAFKTASPELDFTRTASDAQLATLLAAGPYAAARPTVTQTVTDGGRVILVCAGAAAYRVTVSAEGGPAQQVSAAGGCTEPPDAPTPDPPVPPADPIAQPEPPKPAACRPQLALPARARRTMTVRYRACSTGTLTVAAGARRLRRAQLRATTGRVHVRLPSRIHGRRRITVRLTGSAPLRIARTVRIARR